MRWGKRSVTRNTAAVLALSALLAHSAILIRESRAEGLSGYVEFDYSRSDTEIRDAGGRSVKTKSDFFLQRYNLQLDKKFYPNLKLFASGDFQKRDSAGEVGEVKNDTTTTTLRPYLNLNLRTPLYYAEAAYGRNEEKVSAPGSTLTTVRDAVFLTLYWRPDGFPDLRLQYSWDHLFDKDRLNVDTTTNLYQVTSQYMPLQDLNLYYRGTSRDTDLALEDTRTKQITHNGRVNYSNQWWERRITFALDYNYNRQDVDTVTSGAGEVGFPLFPIAGLSALSDPSANPADVVLALNPGMSDGNLTSATGIDLGPPGDSRLRHMGLDFLVATEINTLYVWVDRDVAQVADAFVWRIYTSDDNPSDGVQSWVLRQTVSPAIYSATFNRFEIRFANVAARYVKAVVAPLSPTVPFASAYPIIFVTELKGEIRKPASEVAGELTSTFQNGSLNFRALFVEAVNLAYEFTYTFTKVDPGNSAYTVSNGLSFFRQLNRVFAGAGRVSFEHGEETKGNREALLYTLSITAVPFQTLYHSLSFSGRDETVAGKRGTTNSVFLYNTARFYEGIDGTLNGGISFQDDDAGREVRSTQLNAGANFVPNPKINLSLLYNGTTSVASGGGLAESTTYTRAGEAVLTITPLQTVYLFGSYRIEKTATFASRTILNYSASWSPFPDGALHLTFYYNDIIRSDDLKERSIVPSLRWYFAKRSYLDLSYQNLKTETRDLTTLSNNYTGTVRIPF